MRLLLVLLVALVCLLSVESRYDHSNRRFDKRHEKSVAAFKRAVLKQKLEDATKLWKRVTSAAQRQTILDWHNSWRAKVAKGQLEGQPPAADMIALEWDDRLETSARKWATGCADQMHNENKDRQFSPYPFVGQNYAGSSDRALKKDSMFMGWADEYKDYTYYDNGCKDGSTSCVIGHYTQLVWARTSLVGCHLADCSGADFNKFICDYAMGGNWGSYAADKPKPKPYKNGVACSACPHGFGFCMDGALCASQRACDSGAGTCKCTIDSCSGHGELDSTTCTCTCKEGWGGPKCQDKCEDTIGFCESYKTKCFPSDPLYDQYFMWFDDACKQTCKRCQLVEKSDLGHQNVNGISTTSGGSGGGDESSGGGSSSSGGGDKEVNENKIEGSKTEEEKPSGSNNGCTDKDGKGDCEYWKTLGGCESHRDYMLKHCQLTCFKCGDGSSGGGNGGGGGGESTTCKNKESSDNCKYWKSRGSCETSKYYMKEECAATCNMCADSTEEETNKGVCIDKNENCSGWKTMGYCDQEFLQINCKESCGLCSKKRGLNHLKRLLGLVKRLVDDDEEEAT